MRRKHSEPIGRPPLNEGERVKRRSVSADQETLDNWHEMADAAGMTDSEWLRRVIAEKYNSFRRKPRAS